MDDILIIAPVQCAGVRSQGSDTGCEDWYRGYIPRTGGADRDLFHDYLDARGRAAGHEFPILVKSTERCDFAREVPFDPGALAGAA